MKKRQLLLLSSLLALGIAAATSTTQAAIITFDDLPATDFGMIDNGYQGFSWDWFAYINKSSLPNTGFATGVVSGEYGAYNNFAATATTSGNPFDFNGAYLTAAWKDGLRIEVIGFLNNVALYSETVIVNTTQAQWFSFNFSGIDALSFRAFGGTAAIDPNEVGEHFLLDNFTVNEPIAVPEPSSLALFTLGIASLFARRRVRA
jgi:hypothetical protein